jgi:hypothetical protein
VILALLASACASSTPSTAEPTQALIPATETPIPSPVPPTSTSQALSRPADLTSATASGNADLLPTDTPGASPTLDDPVANDLVALAQRRVAQELNLPVRRIRLVEVKFYTWADTSLGCPQPNESYAQVTVDGYRIVLEAGDKQYIFHTDFDRVLPCDAAREQLPAEPSS